jgi:hypothetical protein
MNTRTKKNLQLAAAVFAVIAFFGLSTNDSVAGFMEDWKAAPFQSQGR